MNYTDDGLSEVVLDEVDLNSTVDSSVTDGTPNEDGEETKVAVVTVNGIIDHSEPQSTENHAKHQQNYITELPTARDISDKLIHDKIEQLNLENHDLKSENGEFRGRVAHLEKCCTELKQKADRASANVEGAKRELQSMVIKYATSEKEVINLKKHFSESERKCREAVKERDGLQTRIKELTAEKKQLFTTVERNVLEAATLRNENEILKNKLAQADVRVQQLQLTIAELTTQLSVARTKLDRIEAGIGKANQTGQQSSQPTTPSRFQLTDDDHQDNEQLRVAGSGTSEHEAENHRSDPITSEEDQETADWTERYLRCVEQNETLSNELELARSERSLYRDQIDGLERKLSEATDQVVDYRRKVDLIESLKQELINKQAAIDSLKDKFDQINSINRDLTGDIDSSRTKEGELLEYTERMTAKLVTLQSEHNGLTEQLRATEQQCDHFREEHDRIAAENQTLRTEYELYQTDKRTELNRLTEQLEQRDTEATELRAKIDELENDIKIFKRKHISSLKELNKEILVLKRQKESAEVAKAKVTACTPVGPQQSNDTCASSTLSSRTNSFTSLTELNSTSGGVGGGESANTSNPTNQVPNHPPIHVSSHSDTSSASSSSNELITSLNDIDKNMLIERILRLQRNLIKRNEKIDFLEEHNEQLTEEVRKKSKLLQHYILKEETGALSTESMDNHKAYLSRRGGGLMSSLYNSSSTDDTVTLERSLEINSKLHAVLEDTLLKNMTLKENLNTLAAEIDRLAKSKS